MAKSFVSLYIRSSLSSVYIHRFASVSNFEDTQCHFLDARHTAYVLALALA